jgi:hypothetical protein
MQMIAGAVQRFFDFRSASLKHLFPGDREAYTIRLAAARSLGIVANHR